MSTQPGGMPQASGSAPGPMPNQRKSWLGRNWLWLLGALVVCGFGFVALIIFVVVGAIRGSDVAKEAFARAQSNALVMQRLGAPISEGWFVGGSINVSTTSGDADLSVPISGPKGKGTVYVTAQKAAGTWTYSLMQAAIEGSGERIDLLARAQAAAPQSDMPSPSPQAVAAVQTQPAQTDASAATPAAPEPSAPAPTSPASTSSDVIQSQDTNTPGVVAEIIQFRRSNGVLDVRIRFRNTSNNAINFYVMPTGSSYDTFYLTAATKKYPMVKGADGVDMAPRPDYSCGAPGVCLKLAPGQSAVWWAKFVAPTADVKRVDLITPIALPFQDVPISDK